MAISIVTTLSEKYWKRTGQYTLPSWKENIPASWNILLYDSPTVPIDTNQYLSASEMKHYWVKSALSFVKDITNRPPGFMKEWDKFYHKSFAQWETANYLKSGIMIWCDADVKFKQTLTEDLIAKCLDGKFCAFLGRDRVDTKNPLFVKDYGQYEMLTPETCFIIYDLNHPIAGDFFKEFKNIYTSMEIFKNVSWCDAGAFISIVKKFPTEYFNDITKDLTPTPLPLNISILDDYLEHWIGTKNKKNKKDVRGTELKKQVLSNE